MHKAEPARSRRACCGVSGREEGTLSGGRAFVFHDEALTDRPDVCKELPKLERDDG